MKKILVLIVVVAGFSFLYWACNSTGTKNASPEMAVTNWYKLRLQQLKYSVDVFEKSIAKNDTANFQQHFMAVRNSYKKVEWLVQYYHPETAKSINGAPIPEAEADAPEKIIEPLGLQVMETYLFPEVLGNSQEKLGELIRAVQSSITRLQTTADDNFLTQQHIVDALRNSLIGLQTLGITGYDAALCKTGIVEGITVLKTVDSSFQMLASANYEKTNLHKLLFAAITYAQNNATDFDAFNRLVFIRNYLQPTTTEIQAWAAANNIKPFDENRFFSATAKTLFDSGAFNPYYFSTKGKKPENPALAKLGEQLFYDVQLSGNGTRSCASCHNPSKGFTDGLVTAVSVDGDTKVARNTPTIINAALQRFQFYDSRVVYLEDQPKDVVENKIEMHGNLKAAALQISGTKQYRNILLQALNSTQATALQLQQALAAYMQTKVYMNSVFDAYMQGKHDTLNIQAQQGFNVFMGKAKCGTCHFAPLFNGMVPPFYDKMESEIIGVPATEDERGLDADVGKFVLYQSPIHKFAFKTTSVRNVGETAPYMHNGVYKTLEQVISFYNKGGGVGIGYQVPYQTLAPEPLNLTGAEQQALKAFMLSLSDKY